MNKNLKMLYENAQNAASEDEFQEKMGQLALLLTTLEAQFNSAAQSIREKAQNTFDQAVCYANNKGDKETARNYHHKLMGMAAIIHLLGDKELSAFINDLESQLIDLMYQQIN